MVLAPAANGPLQSLEGGVPEFAQIGLDLSLGGLAPVGCLVCAGLALPAGRGVGVARRKRAACRLALQRRAWGGELGHVHLLGY
jgi:hypothetical protein